MPIARLNQLIELATDVLAGLVHERQKLVADAGGKIGYRCLGESFCLAMLLVPRERLDVALTCWLAGLAITFVVALSTIVPAYDQLKSLGPISREIGRTVPADEPLYLYDPDETTEALLPLYADRPGTVLRSTAQLEQALRRRGRAFVLAIDKTYRPTQRRLEALLPYRPQMLIEDARPHSRAIRLVLVETPGGLLENGDGAEPIRDVKVTE